MNLFVGNKNQFQFNVSNVFIYALCEMFFRYFLWVSIEVYIVVFDISFQDNRFYSNHLMFKEFLVIMRIINLNSYSKIKQYSQIVKSLVKTGKEK